MLWFKKKEKKMIDKKQELMKTEDKSRAVAKVISGMDVAPYASKAEVNLTEYQAFSISKIGALGMANLPAVVNDPMVGFRPQFLRNHLL